MTNLKQFDVWTADLNPSFGSEPGNIRPVVIIQSNILHEEGHNSTIVCAISSQAREGLSLIRLEIHPSIKNGLTKESYILVDQIRSIDIFRLKNRIGSLQDEDILRLKESINAILSLY